MNDRRLRARRAEFPTGTAVEWKDPEVGSGDQVRGDPFRGIDELKRDGVFVGFGGENPACSGKDDGIA